MVPPLTEKAATSLLFFISLCFADSHQPPRNHNDIFARHGHDHHHLEDEHAHHDHHDGDGFKDWCGTKPLSVQEEKMQQLRLGAFQHFTSPNARGENRRLLPSTCEELCDQCIEIEVQLNLLILDTDDYGPRAPHPSSAVQQLEGNDWSNVDWEQFSTPDEIAPLFEENMKILNSAFRGTPFRFAWDGDYRLGAGEAVFKAFEDRAEVSAVLGSDDLRILDVFVAYQLTSGSQSNGLFVGLATPAGLQEKGRGDGVYIRYDVLTDGGLAFGGLDLGYVLVHEVGHWLGLLHTFETLTTDPADYDCSPDEIELGDFVSDTPVQKGSSQGLKCRSYLNGNKPLPDTCPDLPGEDNIFNFMNYLDDDFCLQQEGEFTCGQKERMFAQWSLFRDRVSSCFNPDEFEIELVIAFESRSLQQTHRVILRAGGEEDTFGEVIYDSIADQVYMLPLLSDVTLVDHCLTRSQTYSVVVSDSDGNGFSADGKVEVYVERELVATIEGSFGSAVAVQIGGDGIPVIIPEESSPNGNSSHFPSESPSVRSSPSPSFSAVPSAMPSARPTPAPTISMGPTVSAAPSLSPSFSMAPSITPSVRPSSAPSTSHSPSISSRPSFMPTQSPSFFPSESSIPSSSPSTTPPHNPTIPPTVFQTLSPTNSTVSSPAPSELTIARSNENSSAVFVGHSSVSFGVLLTFVLGLLLIG